VSNPQGNQVFGLSWAPGVASIQAGPYGDLGPRTMRINDHGQGISVMVPAGCRFGA